MIPPKPLDRAISNIKYRLGKYYVRMGLTALPKVRVCKDPYVINEWPLTHWMFFTHIRTSSETVCASHSLVQSLLDLVQDQTAIGTNSC